MRERRDDPPTAWLLSRIGAHRRISVPEPVMHRFARVRGEAESAVKCILVRKGLRLERQKAIDFEKHSDAWRTFNETLPKNGIERLVNSVEKDPRRPPPPRVLGVK